MSFETTLVLIKPDAIQRGLVGDITKRFERKGLKLVGIKMMFGVLEFRHRIVEMLVLIHSFGIGLKTYSQ